MIQAKITGTDLLIAIAVTVSVALFGLFSTDKLPLSITSVNACGIYCEMALNYDQMLMHQDFDRYYFQKSLLSFFAHGVMLAGDIEKSTLTINYILEIISAVLLVASAVIWFFIAQHNSFSRSAYWIAVMGMFLCQIFVKIVPYAQESPDTAAFFFGMLSLFAVTCKREGWILPIMIATLFVQPQLTIFLVPVFILSYENSPKLGSQSLPLKFGGLIANSARCLCEHKWGGIGYIAVAYFSLFTAIAYLFPLIHPPMHGVGNSLQLLFPFSIAIASVFFAYIFFRLKVFAVIIAVTEKLSDVIFWRRFIILGGILLLLKFIVGFFGQGEMMSATSSLKGSLWAFTSFYYQSIEQPLKFLTAPVVFYGPLFVFFVYSFPAFIVNLSKLKHSLAISCSFILLTLLLPNTESRHFIAFIPWIAFLCLWERAFPVLYVAIFAALSLLFSRFYATYSLSTQNHDPFLMQWGPWFTVELYLYSLVVTTVLSAGVYLMNKMMGVTNDI